ncbi:MAG: hypothetical protein IJV68_00305 [Clostridia bacterium]|nr:hypothetical protein [Clostridia bacterium]
MKKLLAISLAVVMMFALALPILAEETAAPFKIGDTPYDDLAAALTAAEAGQTITMTKDYTEAHGSTQNKFLINKNITIDGGAHKLTITCNANIFPFVVKEGAKFTLKNITYFSNGGGIDVQNGDLTLKDVDLSSIGRAAFKPNGTANIVLDNSHAYIPANGGASETVVIFAGTKGTVTLKNGSTITKANNSNGAVNAAASVMYFNGTGTHTFTMESGTKVINAAPAGTAKLSIFGINGACTLNINIAEGAYTQFDTAIANPVVDFIYGRADANVVLNVHDNAFLVKNGVAASVNPYQSGYNTSGMICTYDALTTSAVEGYTAYKLNTNGTVEENFEYTAADGSTKKAGSLKVAVTAAKEDSTVKLLKDLSISESGIAIA